MNEIIRKLKSFFADLQEKDEQAKKKWLIGLTSASMLIILVLWIISLNSTLKTLSGPEDERSKTGFGATLSQGLKVVGGEIGKNLSEISDKLQSYIATTNSVTIQPVNLNFSNDIEPVTPKKFP